MKRGCLRPIIGAAVGGSIAWFFFWPPETFHGSGSGSDIANGVGGIMSFGISVSSIAFGVFLGFIIGFLANRVK
jgi:hypothetical protein